MIKSITIKITVITLFIIRFQSPINAQRYLFQWMNVPDSISEKLDSVYGHDVRAGHNAHRLGIYDDSEFENGIYTYKGMGPHFPIKYFLYYNDKLYYFQTPPNRDSLSFLKEWNTYIRKLDISKEDIADFSASILVHISRGEHSDAFKDSIACYVNIMLDSCDIIGMRETIDSIYLKKMHIYNVENIDYKRVEISQEFLYGKWYFQTQLRKVIEDRETRYSQRPYGDMPEIELYSNGDGKICNDELNNNFRWSYRGNDIRFMDIGQDIFPERNISLRLNTAFRHNNKLFMELKGKNIVYVLSKKEGYGVFPETQEPTYRINRKLSPKREWRKRIKEWFD